MAIKMKKIFGFLSALTHAGMVAAPMLVDAWMVDAAEITVDHNSETDNLRLQAVEVIA